MLSFAVFGQTAHAATLFAIARRRPLVAEEGLRTSNESMAKPLLRFQSRSQHDHGGFPGIEIRFDGPPKSIWMGVIFEANAVARLVVRHLGFQSGQPNAEPFFQSG